MSVMEAALGLAVIVTGLEPDDEDPDLLRVYIGPRYHWRYVLVEDEDAKQQLRGAWGGLRPRLPQSVVGRCRPAVPGPARELAVRVLRGPELERDMSEIVGPNGEAMLVSDGFFDREREKEREMSDGCPFCEIAAHEAPADFVFEDDWVMAIRPIKPVAPGHLLVIPKAHVRDAGEVPVLTGKIFEIAAKIAAAGKGIEDYNLITSKGLAATQSVLHLHIHVVPRKPDDGLALPWT